MSLPVDTGLGIAGVGAAVPALVQITLDCCSRLIKIYASYLGAETDADELGLLLDLLQSQIPADLHFLKLNAGRLQTEIEARLRSILRVLTRHLEDVIEIFNSVIRPDGSVKRHQWVLEVKPKLASLIPVIEAWQRRFLDHVQLLRFTGFGLDESSKQITESHRDSSDSAVDRLSGKILLARISEIPSDALEIQPQLLREVGSVAHTSLKTLLAEGQATADNLLVECRKHDEDANVDNLKSIVRSIARILAAAGSEARKTHMLQAVGYAYLPHPSREFQLVLKYPMGMGSPRTLREILLDDEMPSINARLDLCRQAAAAAFYTHTSGLVHKSIRPEAFLIFRDQEEEANAPAVAAPSNSGQSVVSRWADNGDLVGTLFLTGFELAREDRPDSFSSMRGSACWEEQIYMHPSRQTPGTRYTMAHDIYSLGVNLLEIALWHSFVRYDIAEQRLVFNGDVLEGGDAICRELRRGAPAAGLRLKALYEEVARDSLRFAMGNRFRDVVLYCLGAVEEPSMGADNVARGHRDANVEEAIGLRYIDKVMGSLDDIRL